MLSDLKLSLHVAQLYLKEGGITVISTRALNLLLKMVLHMLKIVDFKDGKIIHIIDLQLNLL